MGWAVNEGYVEKNIIRTIEPPKVQEPIIEPFTKEEVQALLKACDVSKTWKNRSTTTNTRPTADRDRALILTLLDSGIRASELCGIKKADLDLTSNSIKVIGKGNKPRLVQIGRRTSQAIWKAMLSRLESMRDDDPVFAVGTNGNERPLTRFHLLTLLERLGERAGVKSVYPHRFRHSFAIAYLRNGGDVFTLQQLLGHSELAMVRRYARIAQTDCAVVHQRASPVDNWRL